MDYHDLQKKLFELDPTDPQKDLAKLQAAAQGSQQISESQISQDEEIADIPEGSLPSDVDNLADFAALAGIALNENKPKQAQKQVQQRTSQRAGQVEQRTEEKVASAQMTKTVNEVSQKNALTAQLSKQIAPFSKQLSTIMSNQQLRTKFMQLIEQAEAQDKKQPASAAESTSIKDELYRRLEEHKRK